MLRIKLRCLTIKLQQTLKVSLFLRKLVKKLKETKELQNKLTVLSLWA